MASNDGGLEMVMGNNAGNEKASMEARQEKVAEMYLEGQSQAMIGKALGVSQRTISSDLTAIRERWRANAERDFGAKVAEELARFDQLYQSAWEGYRRSCENAEAETKRTKRALKPPKVTKGKDGKAIVTQAAGLTPVEESTERTVRGQTCDPRFLAELRSIVEMRLKLIGAFPKEAHTTNVNVVTVDWDALASVPPPRDPGYVGPIEEQIASFGDVTLPTSPTPGTNGRPPCVNDDDRY